MSFENNIKQWVLYDNKIKELNESLKSYREKKNTLSTNIISYVNDEKIKNSVVKISDGRLKFTTIKTYNPLTFKFIEECLKEIIKDESQVDKIITHIKEKRETKYVEEIKRFYS